MSSQTQILNKALTSVGAEQVTSIDDDSNNALILRQVYDISRRSILGECKWNFATRRILLSVSADTLPWYDVRETIIYVRPSDVITISGVSVFGVKWREEGDYIISDTSGLGIRYVCDHDTPSKWYPLFVDAFTDILASNIAYMIVNSATLGERYYKKYIEFSLPNATAVNSQQGIQYDLVDDGWENAKFFDGQVDA